MNSSLLTKDLNPDEFNDYYFLKEELQIIQVSGHTKHGSASASA